MSGSSHPDPYGAPTELALAVCHEIGNLVGGVRLQAHLIDDAMSPRELARASLEIDDLCARSAALLAHVRPLVAGDLRTSGPLSPAEILPSVRDLMARHAGPAVTLACRVDPGLPPVETDREALHHLLQSLLFTAFEAVGGEGAVVLGASRHAGGVAFFVEDDGRLDTDPASWPSEALRGRPLVFAVARTIAGRHGGTCEAARQEGRTQVTVVLPAAEATT